MLVGRGESTAWASAHPWLRPLRRGETRQDGSGRYSGEWRRGESHDEPTPSQGSRPARRGEGLPGSRASPSSSLPARRPSPVRLPPPVGKRWSEPWSLGGGGGVEPPSEDSLLRATTCVSGHLGLVPGTPAAGFPSDHPGRDFALRPPGRRLGLSLTVTPLRLYGHSTVGGRRLKPPGLQDSRWRLLSSRFTRFRASARNPGASTSPSKPFRPRI